MPKGSEKAHDSAADVTRQAELVVLDCLKTWKCSRAMEALMVKSSGHGVSVSASERYASDMEAKKKKGGVYEQASLLEYLMSTVDESHNAVTSSTSRSRHSRVPPGVSTPKEGGGDSGVSWTKEEISALKKAIRKTSAVDDKNARWKQIAELVGNSKSKKHCYVKYKELKQDQTNSASRKASPSASKNRHSSAHKHKESSGSVSNNKTGDSMKEDSKGDDEKDVAAKRKDVNDDSHDSLSSGRKQRNARSSIDEDAQAKSCGHASGTPIFTSALSRADAGPSLTRQSSKEVLEELEVEDCEDLAELVQPVNLAHVSLVRSNVPTTTSGDTRLPAAADVVAVQELLFGEGKKTFNSHWEEQGFVFSNIQDLQYGLVQHEGGPCGVLAVVQAYVLRFLLQNTPSDWKNPGAVYQEKSLVQAMAHILWQAARDSPESTAQSTECVLVVKDDGPSSQRRFMAGMRLHVTTSEDQTRQVIAAHLAQFMKRKGSGLVQFVLSVLFTKGATTIKCEMDQLASELGGQLIGAHDYCTQEMVNLLLCGRACSNVFNGEQQLEGASAQESDAVVLRGIARQSVVGFLSLFEAYQYLVVGSHLKQPRFNIWVVCSESHYSVLFVADPLVLEDHLLESRPHVELLYFDGLANQDEEIRLSVETFALQEDVGAANHDLVPPLNLVIRTKWPRATVDWNGVDPLL